MLAYLYHCMIHIYIYNKYKQRVMTLMLSYFFLLTSSFITVYNEGISDIQC